jgi:hypothetical protein
MISGPFAPVLKRQGSALLVSPGSDIILLPLTPQHSDHIRCSTKARRTLRVRGAVFAPSGGITLSDQSRHEARPVPARAMAVHRNSTCESENGCPTDPSSTSTRCQGLYVHPHPSTRLVSAPVDHTTRLHGRRKSKALAMVPAQSSARAFPTTSLGGPTGVRAQLWLDAPRRDRGSWTCKPGSPVGATITTVVSPGSPANGLGTPQREGIRDLTTRYTLHVHHGKYHPSHHSG